MTPLQEFQKLIGVNPDNDFGKITLKAGIKYLKLTNEQGAHFFAQVAHESGGFRVTEENLRYSTTGLLRTFGKYFTKETVKDYAMNPQKIANKVYASRMGNGNEASGMGWKHRGFGFIQLTGFSNQSKFFQSKGLPICTDPILISTVYAMDSAVYFFDSNNLWDICKKVNYTTIKLLTRKINGGYNGLEHRAELTNKFYSWLQ
jgi:putative chitinase